MPRAPLRALADRLGILPEYVDMTGRERRRTSDETRVALLAAMGVEAGDAATARRALEALEARDASRVLAPVRVVAAPAPGAGVGARRGRAGRAPSEAAAVTAVVPADLGGSVEWALELREEGGATHRAEGRSRRGAAGAVRLALPAEPPHGYHELRLTLRGRGGDRTATQTLVVVPPSCPTPVRLLGGQRVFGLTANLYAVRSARNWGAGDFTDLGELLAYARDVGAAFVGVNPLHALHNRATAISPYSPVTRLYRNVLYLDVEAVPELERTPAARERVGSEEFRRELSRLREARRLDYDAVMRLKRPLLEMLHETFWNAGRGAGDAGRAESEHGNTYERYVAEQGRSLEDFATFSALEEHFGGASRPASRAPRPASWHDWPDPYRDPRSPAVEAFRHEHARRVDFHRWVQFELDRQLAEAARRGRDLGLPVGVYQDLAIGTSPDGSDTWSYGSLFVSGASIGAPPDPLATMGQDWGLPPVDPRRLFEGRYDYWITLLRSALRHAGALRIDHVMGLFRQFWIPSGMTGNEGAYVRFPADDLLGILALESERAGALVVGEDLGTVPPEVPPALERWSVLSSKVLYFERDATGGFRAPGDYAPMALATANTHDMATLAGFWRGRDVELRRELGQLPNASEVRAARRGREEERAALVARLRAEALLPQAGDAGAGAGAEPSELDVRSAVHAFLRRTPSWLVGLSLEDLVGEAEPVNLPGVPAERFASWTRRLAKPLEALRGDPAVARALGEERRWVARAAEGEK